MKTTPSSLKRQAGLIDVGAGLALLVLLLAVIFFGFLIYIIVKLAPRIRPRELPPEENRTQSSNTTPTYVQMEQFQFSYQVAGLSNAMQQTDPGSRWLSTVQRSTNLLDWEDLYTTELTDNIEVVDPAPPWPMAFYRARVSRE